jgi:ariadne-1
MEVVHSPQDEFMEVDDEEHGWSEEDDDDDYHNAVEPSLENKESSFGPKLSSGFQFTIISEDEVESRRESIINSVKDILDMPSDIVEKLLIKYRFNKDLVIQKALESDVEMELERTEENLMDSQADSHLCLVWFWEYSIKDVYKLPCNHFLCNTWFYHYLLTAVKGGPQCIRTTCPMNKWNDLIIPKNFKELLNEEEYSMYRRFYMLYFVDCMKTIKWCPAPGCNKAVYYHQMTSVDVYCECGKAFCFYWEQEAHTPVECYYLQMFMEKLKEGEDEGVSSSSDLWVKVHSKNCPKCKSPIEKNMGWMHMTCYSCKYEFCWLCMGDYRKHQEETGIGLWNR